MLLNLLPQEKADALPQIIRDYIRMCQLRSHGIVREKKSLNIKSLSKYHWYYEVNEIGFNFRLTDFQAALGISQIKNLISLLI